MRQHIWRIRVVVAFTLSVISTSPLASQQPQPYRPSISIGGFNVFIGMSLDSLMKTVGSVYSREFSDPNRWAFKIDNDRIAAHVFIENQRVYEIIKYYNYNHENSATRRLREVERALEDFEQLKSAQPLVSLRRDCIFATRELFGETPSAERNGFYTTCGYYSFETHLFVYGDNLGVYSTIRVLGRPY